MVPRAVFVCSTFLLLLSGTTARTSPPIGVQLEMKNVRLHVDEGIILEVSRLRGVMVSRLEGTPPQGSENVHAGFRRPAEESMMSELVTGRTRGTGGSFFGNVQIETNKKYPRVLPVNKTSRHSLDQNIHAHTATAAIAATRSPMSAAGTAWRVRRTPTAPK